MLVQPSIHLGLAMHLLKRGRLGKGRPDQAFLLSSLQADHSEKGVPPGSPNGKKTAAHMYKLPVEI